MIPTSSAGIAIISRMLRGSRSGSASGAVDATRAGGTVGAGLRGRPDEASFGHRLTSRLPVSGYRRHRAASGDGVAGQQGGPSADRRAGREGAHDRPRRLHAPARIDPEGAAASARPIRSRTERPAARSSTGFPGCRRWRRRWSSRRSWPRPAAPAPDSASTESGSRSSRTSATRCESMPVGTGRPRPLSTVIVACRSLDSFSHPTQVTGFASVSTNSSLLVGVVADVEHVDCRDVDQLVRVTPAAARRTL